jgi:hypothetical protein
VILDLYAGFWQGQRLGPDEYLLSADEKSIQILARCHPSLPTIPGYQQRVEFEYERRGTVAYHAAWDVFRGKVFGQVVPNTCIATFNQLMDLVMTQAPYQPAARVFWIVDGGCAHHRNTFPARLSRMYANAVAVSLPVHASWLNQIELYFSIVQRKVLTPLDVTDQATLTMRLLDFQDYYQEVAKPFSWKFTSEDLKKRLKAVQTFSLQLGFTLKTSETLVYDFAIRHTCELVAYHTPVHSGMTVARLRNRSCCIESPKKKPMMRAASFTQGNQRSVRRTDWRKEYFASRSA